MSRCCRGAGWALAAILGLLLAACAPGDHVTDRSTTRQDADGLPDATAVSTADRPAEVGADRQVGTVADAPPGATALDADPLRLHVADVPRWIVGIPGFDGDAVLVVVTESDEVHAFEVDRTGSITAVTPPRAGVDWHRPPTLLAADGTLTLVTPPDDASRDAPVLVLDGDRHAYVGASGDLVVGGDDDEERHALDLLPDGWLVALPGGRVAALAAPTDAYGHGVLGDAVEAQQVVVVDLASGTVESRVDVDGVVEGLRPEVGHLAGLDGPALIVTVSDDEGGADVVAYGLDGRRLASTGPIGTGNRWRHVLAVDPDVGLVEVVTPHLGKELRIARVEGGRLTPDVAVPGVMSSHAIGSRDLDQAKLLGGDVDRAVVGPGADRMSIVAIDASDGTVLVRHELPAPWASNLAAVPHADGVLVAVGAEDGSVLVWPAAG